MYRSLLVPLDGSTLSEQALPLACSIARTSGATITVAHVRTPDELYASVEIPPLGDEAYGNHQQVIAETYVQQIAQRLSADERLTVISKVLTGTVADTLYEYSVTSGIDLIVMTTHGRGMVSRLWLGSVADTLIRHTPVPILLVRAGESLPPQTEEPTLQHILIPLDGSTLAESILEQAMILGRLNTSRFTLLKAISPVTFIYTSPPAAAMVEQEFLDQECAASLSYLTIVAERLRSHSFTVDTQVVIDTAWSAITTYAQQHEVDLIAMATHGRGGFKRLVLGSVADKVVRSTCTPVLLAHPQPKYQ